MPGVPGVIRQNGGEGHFSYHLSEWTRGYQLHLFLRQVSYPIQSDSIRC